MSVKVEKFKKKHLNHFKLQPLQKCFANDLDDKESIKFFEDYFYTLIKDDKVLGFGSIIPESDDVGQASVFLSEDLKRDMIYVHKHCVKFLKYTPFRRIFMRCHVDFSASLIWAQHLGFEFEGIEKEYIKGHDFARFAMIKDVH